MTHDRPRPSPAALSLSCRYFAALAFGCLFAPIAVAGGSVCDRPMADAIPMVEKMEQSWSEVTDYTSVLLKTERFIDGAITEERGRVKFRKPNQLYLHVTEGANEGAQLLFPKPGTETVILGRPGGVSGAVAGFLVNMPAVGNLIPYEFDLEDGRLTNGQHHPLPDSTLAGMTRLVSINLRTAARHLEGSVCIHGTEIVDGQPATKIEVHLPPEAGLWHTVAEGETLWTLGEDYEQDRYVIQYNNPSVESDKDLRPGERIFVPRYYAPRAVLWMSNSSFLPLKLQMFDVEERLYESYTNTNLRLDVGLTDEDFDPVLHGFPAVTTSDEGSSETGSKSR